AGVRPVRPFATTLLLAGWVAWIAWVGACGTQRTRPPSWPITKVSGRPQATLPIRDPLQGADLTVQMTLEGPQGRRATLWMTLDSGAGLTTVPSGAARELGLPEFTTQ